ncbi:hypothetical protein ISF_08256 [Cordyceps fumosorosea ARSEF 2679]|uniref:Uncharacterized protein n=1 Tax=Cordyceps fumosorosea (strain ARSEF 2679) TaxID=1081104 RepID=A0A162IB44_CORFA|nr:hypothetical protein ISF_08256 [Cordyceps fumosorosea ARSEF 2679]OAA54655.1 hypothetical protein ISF_08256 [Cordyceps fumosorosea ARSEF 2679]
MRFSILALAVGAGASAIPASPNDCFREHHDALAQYAECGSQPSLSTCLSQLAADAADATAVERCYTSRHAQQALARCDELAAVELRRRTRDEAARALITPAPIAARENAQGDDCFTTEISTQKICPGFISGTSFPCTMGPVTAKSCRSGWLCTEDPNGKDICMSKVDKLDVGGIIISIVFAVIVVGGISFLIFMSCAESRAQKKMKARAEATALARAATKKKRAEEVRAPLMAQQQEEYQTPGGSGSVNPFGDGQPH